MQLDLNLGSNFKSCVSSNFFNFSEIIYHTTKIDVSNLVFLIFCVKWVIKWKKIRIKNNKPLKKSLLLIHFSYNNNNIIIHIVVGQTKIENFMDNNLNDFFYLFQIKLYLFY